MKKFFLIGSILASLLFAKNLSISDINISIQNNEIVQKFDKGNYNKGFKYYKKYLKKYFGKSSEMLRKWGIKNDDDIKKFLIILKNKNILEKYYKEIYNKELEEKAFKKINKAAKHPEDLYEFLKGVIEGKIPAGCS